MRHILASAAVAVLFSSVTCATAFAQNDGDPHPPTYVRSGGPVETRISECNNIYFPEFEVRAFQDIPVEVMIVYRADDHNWQPTAAAGLDLLGLHLNLVHPTCTQSTERADTAIAPLNGFWLTLMLNATASFSVLGNSTVETLTVTDPTTMTTSTGEATVTNVDPGAMLTGSFGLLLRGLSLIHI